MSKSTAGPPKHSPVHTCIPVSQHFPIAGPPAMNSIVTVKLDYLDIARYADRVGPADRGHNRSKNNVLNARFAAGREVEVGDPCVFIDRYGREVGWYLPEILTAQRKVGTCALPSSIDCVAGLTLPFRQLPNARPRCCGLLSARRVTAKSPVTMTSGAAMIGRAKRSR